MPLKEQWIFWEIHTSLINLEVTADETCFLKSFSQHTGRGGGVQRWNYMALSL